MFVKKKRLKILFVGVMVLILLMGIKTNAIEYKEAPMLVELVKADKLPPLKERLPQKPVIVKPLREVGKYGGTIRTVFTGVADWWNLARFGVRDEPLLYVNREGKVVPNLLEKWEYLDNGKILKLYLRKGIKWSDGYPFTVDDIIYDLELRQNPNLPLESAGLASMVEVKGIKKIDDYTVELPLKQPYPIEFTIPYTPTVSPKHYLIKYDPRYNPKATWADLEKALSPQRNSEALVDKPELTPWKVVEYSKTRIVAERNPYYWKVDSAGNQLPYIDRIIFTYVASTDIIPAMVKAGQIDFQERHISLQDYSFYKQNELSGNYRTVVLQQCALGPNILLNYAVKDEDLQKLFRNRDFRIALSIGIDREAINRALYFGLAEPWGRCPLKNSYAFPGERFAKLYIEYDPDRANKILDKLGLKDTNKDGIREINGKPVSIIIDMDKGGGGGPVQVAELIAAQWRKIGIQAIVNPIERSLMLARWKENSHQAFAWQIEGGLDPARMAFAWSTIAPPDFMWSNVGVPLQIWEATNGKEGIEPPDFIKEINRLMKQAQVTLDRNKRASLLKKIARLHAENLYTIPTTTYVGIAVVSNKLQNIPDSWLSGMDVLSPRNIEPWQFFYKE